MKNIAVILAAGNSTRFGSEKLFLDMQGQSLLGRTIEAFQNCSKIDEIILVTSLSKKEILQKELSPFFKLTHIIEGGKERFDSFKKSILFLQKSQKENARIIIHNGGNPFIASEEIFQGIALAEKKKNVIFGFFTPNSIKRVKQGEIIEALNRDEIFEAQTPQISDLETFVQAVKTTKNIFRDEAELLSSIGEKVWVYECSRNNRKITFPSDFPTVSRIGIGEDSHRFTAKYDSSKPLLIGGVKIDTPLSFDANSDGDIVLHALCNAITSAIGDKTLSEYADPMCHSGITDSQAYLKEALQRATTQYPAFQIQNVILSLEGKNPKIAPHHEKIQKKLMSLLNLTASQVGITYTTGEGLSDFGKGLGLRCTVSLFVSL